MTVLLILEIIGTVAFAVSGAIVAIEKEMDIFGVVILGTTTAVGGGIIRDLILGVTPPAAFRDPVYALLAIEVSLIVFFPKINRLFRRKNNIPLLIMDSLGLGVFTVVGVRAGMTSDNLFLAVFVGVLTGVGGGVVRDLFAGNRPYIFIKHFYACASLIGATLTVALWTVDKDIAMVAGATLIILLRFLAARFRWSLPRAHAEPEVLPPKDKKKN